MDNQPTTDHLLSIFIQLEAEIREAQDETSFGFTGCNSTKRLFPYHQAIFWQTGITGNIDVKAISATAQINQDAPYIIWLKSLIKHFHNEPETKQLSFANLPEKLREETKSFSPANCLWCPFAAKEQTATAGLLFFRDQPFSEHEITIIKKLNNAYTHAWFALQKPKHTLTKKSKRIKKSKLMLIIAATVIIVSLLPIRQSVLAPAEITPKEPVVVSSPLDGVIEQIQVEPNQTVSQNTVLFNLDPTDFQTRAEVAEKDLRAAQEKYRKAAQHAFNEPKSKAQLSVLKIEIDKMRTELNYAQEHLNKVHIVAPISGTVIYADKNDWLGKPVKIGERVMLIANPKQKELDIYLPAQDAITVQPGSQIKLFTNTDPLHPIKATIRYASYNAELKENGQLVYLLKADFKDQAKVPRIGLRGTAKIYGERVTLFYYLFWKPLSALRQTLGL